MNRRDFLKNTTFASLAAAAGGASFNRLLAQSPAATAATSAASVDLKIGLNAYSFARELNTGMRGSASGGGSKSGEKKGGKKSAAKSEATGGAKGAGTVGTAKGMTLFGLIDYCANPKHRFDAVDITGYYFPGYNKDTASVPTDDFIKRVKKHAAEREMPISGTGIGNTLTGVDFDKEYRVTGIPKRDEGGNPKLLANDIARIKAWIEVSAKLGAPVLRIFAGLEPSYLMKANIKPNDPEKNAKAEKLAKWRAETFKRMVDAINQVLPLARQNGVIVGIQNHGDFLQNADQCIELLDAVGDRKNFGLILDTGYFQTPDPYIDMERMMPYAVNFQLKEFARVCPTEYVDPNTCFQPMDLERVMRIVRRSDYRGYLPIETLSAGKKVPYDPYKEVPPFLAKVRAAVTATA